MTAPRPAVPRCRCGCGAQAIPGNKGGFSSQLCYVGWQRRQRPKPDDGRMVALRLAGATMPEIARQVGWSKAMIRRRLKALGVPSPERPASGGSKRRHQKAEGAATPGRHHTKSLAFRRLGSYQHPPLGEWLLLACPTWCAECRAAVAA